MDIKIIEDKNNVLLKRRELKFEVTFEGPTPTRMDVKNKMAALLNVPLELVVIQRMKNDFGRQLVNGYAKIYEDAARMKQVEKDYVLERNKLPEAPEEQAEAVQE
ncbi:30S ribosomal protein S24e [uncultured Methanomethylovorans sp.]|uniref:30S ribosomal protein S24e n=1 Tax=uncultured Methanomethylovorans sp. TaxID=183759 RepID=UPI002AA9557B|nr:30S ribosomal protein S24e [uncultured Methanomethylovorans sp.]